jgi:hypothetical protein
MRAHRELLVVDLWSQEFIRMNLSASPFLTRLWQYLTVRYLK